MSRNKFIGIIQVLAAGFLFSSYGAGATLFEDNFDSGMKSDWKLSFNDGTAVVKDGVCNIKTVSEYAALIMSVNSGAEKMTCKAEFVFKNGNPSNTYGIVFNAEGFTSAQFAVTGNKYYSVCYGDKTITDSSSAIRGIPSVDGDGNVTYFRDTLMVCWKAGSESCFFYVNNVQVCEVPGVNQAFTSAGVFSQGILDIDVDNFYVGANEFISVKQPFVTRKNAGSINYALDRKSITVDPLGRLVNINRIQGARVSSGLYMMRDQRYRSSALILKK